MKKQRNSIKELQIQLQEHRERKELLIQEKLLQQKLKKELNRKTINWKKEAARVKTLSLEGKTNKEIGEIYGVSGARISQIILKHFPAMAREVKGQAVLSAKKKQHYLESLYQRTGRSTPQHEDDLSRAMAMCFSRKKQNAKGGKWEWLITPADVTYSLTCPILGMEIDWFAEARAENSPSFDRIDTTKGYIPGNVIICSWRANRIKNDGNSKEHQQIADFLKEKGI